MQMRMRKSCKCVNMEFLIGLIFSVPAGGFTNAVPGIILHIVFIPIIVMALEKAGFMRDRTFAGF